MKPPSLDDEVVEVQAYMTDERFGYDYWAARQFMAPATAKPALLLIFDTDDDRAAYLHVHLPQR